MMNLRFFAVSLLVFASLFFVLSFMISLFSPEMEISITGFATQDTQEGIVNLSVNETFMVDFIQSSINWGVGEVAEAEAILDSYAGTVSGGSWGAVSEGFVIKNVRNGNVSLKLQSGKDADSFIGGTSPSYQYRISNRDDSACIPPSGFELNKFYDVNTSDFGTLICDKFLPGLEIEVDLKLVVPSDSDKGSLSDSLSVTFSEA